MAQTSSEAPKIALVLLGYGKSAGFYIANSHPGIPTLILTEFPVKTNKFSGPGGAHHYQQTSDAAGLEKFIRRLDPDLQLIFITTTNPERSNYWLQKLSNSQTYKLILSKDAIFFLPQSPNPYLAKFTSFGTVVIGDYYMGIGGMAHKPETATSYVHAGLKENLRYAITPNTFETRNAVNRILPQLAFGQVTVRDATPLQLALLPTNALLHTVGIVCHIAKALVDEKALHPATMNLPNAGSFLDQLNGVAEKHNILNLLGTSLQGKGFYREMPPVGPDIIMDQLGNAITTMREKLIKAGLMPASSLDKDAEDGRSNAHIFHHLKGKYRNQFSSFTGLEVDKVSFGKFININPPYQNPQIVFPTRADGTINTEHRFFTEEMPTMLMLYKLGTILQLPYVQLEVFEEVIRFNQRLAGKQYLADDNNLGKDAPDYLKPLRTAKNFVDYIERGNVRGL